MAIAVEHRPHEGRYVVLVDGREAGHGVYRRDGDRVEIPYTEVAPQYGGRGVGTALVHGMLDDLEAQGVTQILPTCSFVAAVMRRDPARAGLRAA